ncbi:MAG: efflux RND transporter permease subunit [Thermoleophilia bacterium]
MSLLTRISLRNRSVVALVVVAVLLIGGFAVTSLRQELIPSIEYPALTVFAFQQGASPADIERGVTTPLETGLKSLSGLKELDSYSNEGMSIIVALFEYGTDMTQAQADAQQAVERVRPMLPAGVQPEARAVNFGDFPVMQLAASSPRPTSELSALLAQKVVPRLQQVPGVGDVSLSGTASMRLQIELKPLQMAQLGVSPQAVVAALRSANVSVPAGTLTSQGTTVPVRVVGEASSLAALRNLPLESSGPGAGGSTFAPESASAAAPGGTGAAMFVTAGPPAARPSPGGTTTTPDSPLVTLGQVANLEIVPDPATSITRTNGRPSVGISITKSAGGNVVEISREVRRLLPALQRDLGEGATITTVVDQAPYITQSISSMWREGILGAVFAILVILLFLRSWRSTVVAGVSIPLSVIVALIVLWSRGDSLNMLTLAGLTIAIGRVIDDAIVVLENAYRHLQEGDDPRTAAHTATREVSAAITASTLTTVAVFLPLGFVHGLASEFFRPFALTVTFALLASLVVALTVVPVAVTWLLSKKHGGHVEKGTITGLQRLYLPVLRAALGHKVLTVGAAFLLFAGSMALTPLLKTNLLDHSQETTLTITQQLPPGTEIARTAAAAAKVEDVVAGVPGIDTYQVTVGSNGGLFGPGGGTNASSARAQFLINTDGKRDKAAIIQDLRTRIGALDGAGDISVTEGDTTGGDTSLLEVRIYADDPAVMQQANRAVLTTLGTVPGLTNISSNLSENMPQIAVKVDPVKAAAAGLDAAQVGQFMSLVLSGIPLGPLPTEHGPLPALLTLPALGNAGADALDGMVVAGSGGLVPLSSVAEVNQVEEPAQVTHTDGQRTATVSATVTSGNIGTTTAQVKKALQALDMPAGARWEIAGASEQMSDMFRTLGIAMAVAVIVVYLIMVGTFRSLLNPLILLVSIPFAAVGAVVLLLVTGTSLGMPSLIGLLMLVGIVVTNAIVLLDLIEQFRDQGMDAPTAVVEGARRRLRPILMTAAATILALAPMALGLGEGSFLSRPLAVVVIGGLITSTLLTLVLVPVVYLAFDRFRRRPGAARLT